MKKSELKELIREEVNKLLTEQLYIDDTVALEELCGGFVKVLIQKGVVKSMHKDLTSSDVAAQEYSEDLCDIIRNGVNHWISTVNSRSGR